MAVLSPRVGLAARQRVQAKAAATAEWKTYGADLASTRYSPLDQINASQLLEADRRVAAVHQRLRAETGHALLGDPALCRQRALHDGRNAAHGGRA